MRKIFVNCPFDVEFKPILEAILFAIFKLGYRPLIASENSASLTARFAAIEGLIAEADFSLHDLSRTSATKPNEPYRLNMPFELGVDYGYRTAKGGHVPHAVLVLEGKAYSTKEALSDLAGCDFQFHEGKPDIAVRKVRNWISQIEHPTATIPAATVQAAYEDFTAANFERLTAEGFGPDDIADYPMFELLDAMRVSLGIADA